MILILSYAGVKVVAKIRAPATSGGSVMGPKGPGQFVLEESKGVPKSVSRLNAIVTLGADGEAAATALVNRLGDKGVIEVGRYIQADSKAARFVYEHGVEGAEALHKAKGNLAEAAKLLPTVPKLQLPAPAAVPEPIKTEPVKTEPVKTEPVKTEPVKTVPVKTEPAKTEPAKTEPAKTEPAKTEPAKTEPAKTEPAKTEPAKTEPAKTDTKPPFPANEFLASDPTWKQWPPPKPASVHPDWDKPGGARYRYDRYRYQKWEESGKPATPPKDLLSPEQYYDRYVAPKAVGQSPGEMGSPEHKALVVGVRDANGIGTQTMGEQRPDAVGRIDQPIKIPGGPTVTPQKGGRVLYEADNFFKDGSQIVSEGREQVRQFRKDNPDATIVVQDAANPKNIIIYEPGTQPPPPGPLKPGTANKVPVK